MKKSEPQEFLTREDVDIICIQETHLTGACRFTLRGYKLLRHDRVDRHKRGIRNTIPAVEFERAGKDSEYLAIKVVL